MPGFLSQMMFFSPFEIVQVIDSLYCQQINDVLYFT